MLHKLFATAAEMKTVSKAHLALSLTVILASVTAAFFCLRDHYLFPVWRETILSHTLLSLILAFAFTTVLELALREKDEKKN